MNSDELAKWAADEVNALISCGIDPLDAQNTVKRVLAKLPAGADPRTWTPTAPLGDVEITENDIQDARADWYASETVPAKFKMILDAPEVDGIA